MKVTHRIVVSTIVIIIYLFTANVAHSGKIKIPKSSTVIAGERVAIGANSIKQIKAIKAGQGSLAKSSSAGSLAARSDNAVSGSQNLLFKSSPKHGKYAKSSPKGIVSPGPKNGQLVLNNSVQVKQSAPGRVGVDKANSEIVVFSRTEKNIYHGHVQSFKTLTSHQKNALVRNRLVNLKGKIL